MLILDLDDTIFETKSIESSVFDGALSLIKEHYSDADFGIRAEQVITDLWTHPMDVVFEKYHTPKSVASDFYKTIAAIDYQTLDIKTYDDYIELKRLAKIKILVTTGIPSLQWAKIKALGIEKDFSKIYIDDPVLVPRKHKIDIFNKILLDSKRTPDELWVIGDNPESEIKAGKTLGMNTIQRRSLTKASTTLADYAIDTFAELKSIIG